MSSGMMDVQSDGASLRSAHGEVLQALSPVVQEHLTFLKAVDAAWQPADCLPDFSSDGWHEQLMALRRHTQVLPDDLLVVLVGDMVTEEALPSYSMALNAIVDDREGTSPAPWARWLRGWTAEENRHGDLLHAYLRLGGRVRMKSVEQTVQWLIANGFNAGSADDPYHLLVYTSFQERATRISHGNVGRLAAQAGDPTLARICRLIASDEARHEAFYSRMMAQVLDIDPSGGVLAFHRMLQRQIAMPGRLMHDGRDPDLFDHFAVVAQRTGVYTALDYASIVAHLVSTWNIAGRSVSGDAARAQEELCRAAPRYMRLAERVAASVRRQPPVSFAWIDGRLA